MSNDLDALINMDPLELSKNDDELLKIIAYYRKIRGHIEEGGKNTARPAADGKAILQKLGLATKPKEIKRRI